MQEKIITLYCVCAEFLAAYGYQDDPQAQMTTAEVMTVSLPFLHSPGRYMSVYLENRLRVAARSVCDQSSPGWTMRVSRRLDFRF